MKTNDIGEIIWNPMQPYYLRDKIETKEDENKDLTRPKEKIVHADVTTRSNSFGAPEEDKQQNRVNYLNKLKSLGLDISKNHAFLSMLKGE